MKTDRERAAELEALAWSHQDQAAQAVRVKGGGPAAVERARVHLVCRDQYLEAARDFMRFSLTNFK